MIGHFSIFTNSRPEGHPVKEGKTDSAFPSEPSLNVLQPRRKAEPGSTCPTITGETE